MTINVYIAGPEVLYKGGTDLLAVMRAQAELRGFKVTLPNDNDLGIGRPNPQHDADAIFANCAVAMNESDAIICDLEFFRGTEPDGGSIYELGMAYARGIRLIGFTRDKRAMIHKDPGLAYRDGAAYDSAGRRATYSDLPFAPSVMSSTTIVEGSFADALEQLVLQVEQDRKDAGLRPMRAVSEAPSVSRPAGERPRVYLAGIDRYADDGASIFARRKHLCESLGLEAVSPLDDAPNVPRITSDDPLTMAANLFDHCQQHVRDADAIVADLNDFRGWEPSSDVSFECGMGFQLGKRLFGYMDDTRRMVDRIPNLGPDHEYADLAGAKAEPWDYPINLMFASSMPVLEGSFEQVIHQVAADLLGTAT